MRIQGSGLPSKLIILLIFTSACLLTGLMAACDGGGSSGCGGGDEILPPECTDQLKPGDDRKCLFNFQGQERKFYIYAPSSFDPNQPASLIVDCHGMSESAEVHIGVETFYPNSPKGYGSSWRRAVQGDNAIVVSPEGISLRWTANPDVAFLNKVADMVEGIANVDKEKVYITGISMGGMITYETACDYTERWRGMGPVAALTRGTMCNAIARPLPVIAFHAEGDQLTSYENDYANIEHMAELNNCKSGPVVKKIFGGPNSDPDPVCYEAVLGPNVPDAADPAAVPLVPCPASRPQTTCVGWDQCDEGVEVMFCTVDASTQRLGGHILYTNDTGLSLGAVAWPFFKKFQD